MKNKKINIVILIFALSLVLYFSLKEDLYGVLDNFFKVKIWCFFLAIILFLIALFFKSLSLNAYLKKQCGKYNLKKAYNLTLIGQFLNGITPFQSGGQPFQVSLLKKEGMRISDSTSAMLKDSLSYQIALVFVGFVSLLLNYLLHIFDDKTLNFLVIIWFIVNFIVLLFLISLILFKRQFIKIINTLIDFFCKFKVLRKLNEKKDSISQSVNRFYRLLSDSFDDKMLLLKTVITNIIAFLLLYTIPYVVFLSLGYNNEILYMILSTSFVMLIGNFVPIPGATGGIEYGFYKFFGFFVSGNMLTSAMLLWRFITYIFGMMIGFVSLVLRKGIEKWE